MCIVERKTYLRPEGEQVVETTRLCRAADTRRPCAEVEYKDLGRVRVVRASPSPDPATATVQSDSSSPVKQATSKGRRQIVTQARDGTTRVYRPVSARWSLNTPTRPSPSTRTARSPAISSPLPSSKNLPSLPSSPAYITVEPKRFSGTNASSITPPDSTAMADEKPFAERIRSPYPPNAPPFFPPNTPPTSPPPSVPEVRRRVNTTGTAIYDRPPSMEMPRALDNERVGPISPPPRTDSFAGAAGMTDAKVSAQPTNPSRQANYWRADIPMSRATSAPGIGELPPRGSSLYPPRAYDEGEDPIRRHEAKERSQRRKGKATRRLPRQVEEDEQTEAPASPAHNTLRDGNAQYYDSLPPSESNRQQHRRSDPLHPHVENPRPEALMNTNDSEYEARVQAEYAQMARERAAAAQRRRSDSVASLNCEPFGHDAGSEGRQAGRRSRDYRDLEDDRRQIRDRESRGYDSNGERFAHEGYTQHYYPSGSRPRRSTEIPYGAGAYRQSRPPAYEDYEYARRYSSPPRRYEQAPDQRYNPRYDEGYTAPAPLPSLARTRSYPRPVAVHHHQPSYRPLSGQPEEPYSERGSREEPRAHVRRSADLHRDGHRGSRDEGYFDMYNTRRDAIYVDVSSGEGVDRRRRRRRSERYE